MNVKLKNHFREGLFIFISILGAFALESYRESLLQVRLKDKLLNQLLITLNEDIKHMSEVNAKLDITLASAAILMQDHLSDNKKLNPEVLAKKFSDMRFMNLSFFPQQGVYNQLLASNSLENIENPELKKEIVYVYENLLKRIQAGDPILDEMRWKSFANLSTEILVIATNDTKKTQQSNLPFAELKVDYFNISSSYYESKEVLNFYNQVILFISEYQKGLQNVEREFQKIIALLEQELNIY